MTNICPEIPDTWKGTVTEAAKILETSRSTLYRYLRIGAQNGGLDADSHGIRGHTTITGREIKRFWNSL